MGCSWSKQKKWNLSGNSVSSECESIIDDDLYTNETKTNVETKEQNDLRSNSQSVCDRVAYFQQQNDHLARKVHTTNVAQPSLKSENVNINKDNSPKIWTGENSTTKQHASHGLDTYKKHVFTKTYKSKTKLYSSTLKRKNSYHRKNSYQKRKVNGFKDLKLEQQSAECLQIKSRLRHVGDPDSVDARKKKLQKMKEEEETKVKSR